MNYVFRTNTLRRFVQECMKPSKTSNFPKVHTIDSLNKTYGVPAAPRGRTDHHLADCLGKLCTHNGVLCLPLTPITWDNKPRYDHFQVIKASPGSGELYRHNDWVNYTGLSIVPLSRLDELLEPDRVCTFQRVECYNGHPAEFPSINNLLEHCERTSWSKSLSTHSS